MKILYYDCFCGISGDMNLGALLDLGVEEDFLRSELSKLSLDGEFEMNVRRAEKRGITGTKVDIAVKSGGHPHRKLADIENLIKKSGLAERVKSRAMDMFSHIAAAEGKVHNLPPGEVHFHEVGAVDSLVDIVGAAIALDFLNPDRIIASSIQVGGGFVKCAHGVLPVPAPATTELLCGIPIKTGLVPYETTTPTGAAILAANADAFTDDVAFSIMKTGYGLGTNDFDIPNVLRVFLGDMPDGAETEEQVILEANIDDMNPELIGFAEEKLFGAGALDVYKIPVMMKKGRPAILISVLTDKAHEQNVAEVLFTETTTIGLRRQTVQKVALKRDTETVHTKYGDARVKKAYFKDKIVNIKPEYADAREMALKNNVPISAVYSEISNQIEKEKKR